VVGGGRAPRSIFLRTSGATWYIWSINVHPRTLLHPRGCTHEHDITQVISASLRAKKISLYVDGKLVAVQGYTVPVVQCPKGTKLEIGDGWSANDSRRWRGEMRKFAMYTLPKTAVQVS
jgi:hypothetical protein